MECICIPTALPVNLGAVEPVAFQLPNVNVAADAAAAHTLHADVVAAAQHAESDAHDGGSGAGAGAGAGANPSPPQRRAPSSSDSLPQKSAPSAKEAAEQRRAEETARALEALRAELRERRGSAVPHPPALAVPRAAWPSVWLVVLLVALGAVVAQKLVSLR